METPKTSSDEINLEELLLKIILVIKRNLVLIVAFFIIGTALGFTYGMLGTKIYESKMLITSDYLTDSYAEKLNKNLNSIIADGNMELLAAKLNLSREEASLINAIEMEGVQKERPSQNEKVKQPFFLFISARTYDPAVYPKLEKGLVFYFENNEFSKARVEQTRIYDRKLILKIEDEIQSLEKFKTRIFDGTIFDNSKGNIMIDPGEINSKIIELTKEKLSLEKELSLISNAQVVEGFTQYLHPAKPNRIISLAAGSSLGLIFVGMLIAFKWIRKMARWAQTKA